MEGNSVQERAIKQRATDAPARDDVAGYFAAPPTLHSIALRFRMELEYQMWHRQTELIHQAELR